jgi:hypothetical protein
LTAENQNFTELSFADVQFDEDRFDQFEDAGAVSHLVTGLQSNKNLKRFVFSWSSGISDRGKSRIITALEGHPTLEHLGFDIESHQSNKTTLESLRRSETLALFVNMQIEFPSTYWRCHCPWFAFGAIGAK